MQVRHAAVTGATGHLGNTLVRHLLERGVRVRALSHSGHDAVPLEGLPVEVVPAEVGTPDALEAAFRGVDVVFHTAGLVSITTGQEARLHAVNVDGTRNVIAACKRAGVQRLVFTSSVHALTEPAGGTLDEAAGYDPARAHGPYGRSKAEASLLVEEAAKSGGLDAVLVLPTGCLGPWDFRFSEVGNLVARVGRARMPVIIGGGYEWVDVRDVAAGTLLAAERGARGASYLLNADRLSTAELCNLVAKAAAVRPPLVCLPLWVARAVAAFGPPWERLTGRRALLTPYAVHTLASPFRVSSARARKELGFVTRPVPESLADAWQWLATHPGSPMLAHLRIGPGRATGA